jgi:hypothetical protein
MEAIYLDCGARRPQLKRVPLGGPGMASGIHSLVPKLAFAFTPLAMALSVYAFYRWRLRSYDVPSGTDIFDVVEGRWAFSGATSNCDSEAVTVSFTSNHRDMVLVWPAAMLGPATTHDSIGRYPVLGHTRHSIRIVRRGETVLASDSTPVIWDLTLRSPHTYVWHRSDWLPVSFTREYERCPRE